jgi:energy-converting hydrogenase Eha subunit E
MWFGKNAKQLEWEHLERMKCLERGLPLPDAELAWTKVVEQRGQQLTAVLIIGTIALVSAPVGMTTIILIFGRDLPAVGVLLVLAVIWCASAFVLLCLARHAMAGLLHLKRPTPAALPRPPTSSGDALRLVPHEQVEQGDSSEGIQTSWFGRPAIVNDE